MNIPHDKRLHLIVGCVIFLIASIAVDSLIAAGAVFVASIGKEAYDHFHPAHTVDVWDALATFAGGAIGWGALLIFAAL